ncbi:hypothetical protein C8R47DRAFT_1219805 [Mycena vitilis]|nr:hypothetical protein C8R47DRAFT_1219805 [Mycena vitilis]
MAKEDRKSLRLWAEGARESVLEQHIARYGDALERGRWVEEREVHQSICNEFHARISWRLKDHEEPDLPLPEYDAEKIQPVEALTAEEEEERALRVRLLNERIRRWLKYRVRRLRKQLRAKIGSSSSKDPWTLLLSKLSGVTSPPKARQAYQQFMHEEYESKVAPLVATRWAEETGSGSNVQTKKNPDASFRSKIAREVFGNLSDTEREGYKARAKEAAADARAEYDKALVEAPCQSPEAKQRCIDNVGAFLGPILQGIQERTGMHSTIIMGGPVPKYGGDLRSIYVSYGRNRSTNPQHFSAWAKDRFDAFLGVMKEYLGTAFTEQDIEAAALKDTLAGAKYRIAPDPPSDVEESESSSDSSGSDSQSDTDSNADSDDSAVAKKQERKAKKAEKKKRHLEKQKKRLATEKKAARALAAPVVGTKRKRSEDEGDASANDDAGAKKKKKADAALSTKKRKRSAEEGDETVNDGSAGAGEVGGKDKKKERAKRSKKANALGDNDAGDVGGGKEKKRDRTKRSKKTDTAAEDDAGAKSGGVERKRGQSPPPRKSLRLQGDQAPSTADAEDPAPPTQLEPATAPAPTGELLTPPTTQAGAAHVSSPTPPTPSQPSQPLQHSLSSPLSPSPSPPSPSPPSPSPPSMPEVEFPADAPEWLTSCVKWLMKEELGVHYRALVAALIALETKYGFDPANDGKLGSEKRPSQVYSWIRGGRGTKVKFPPSIGNVGHYADEWQAWWDTLQPAWREKDDAGHWKQDSAATGDDVWDPLEAPGKNGCLSVVASLYFWGISNKNVAPELEERWERAVLDVTWMLEELCASIH